MVLLIGKIDLKYTLFAENNRCEIRLPVFLRTVGKKTVDERIMNPYGCSIPVKSEHLFHGAA